MGNKGNNRHIKRLASASRLRVKRKEAVYLSKPKAGRHKRDDSVALGVILREQMEGIDTAKEANKALLEGSIEVNGKVIKEFKYPVGLEDYVHIKPSNEYFKLSIGAHGSLKAEKVKGYSSRIMKVIGKYIAPSNKLMIVLHSGETREGKNEIKVNDSILLKDDKIEKVLKLEKGAECIVISGTHASETGRIKEIKQGTSTREALIEIESNSKNFETLLNNIMVIGA